MGSIEEIIKNHRDGIVINLLVTPDAKSVLFPAGLNSWRKCIEINVKAPAKDNKANKEVIKTIADFFKKPVNDVFVVSGAKNNKKSVLVKGVTKDFIFQRLRDKIDGF